MKSLRFGKHGERGLTLVELMIALLLGSVLMLGVVQLFSNMRVTYSANEGLSRLQEQGRFAIEFLSNSMRMSGHMGCHSASQSLQFHNALSDPDGLLYRFNTPLEGYSYTRTGNNGSFTIQTLYPEPDGSASNWTPSLDGSNLASRALPGSDVFVVRYLGGDGAVGGQPNYGKGQGSPPTFATPGNDFKQGEVLLVSDCAGVSIAAQRQNADNNAQVTFGGGKFPHISNPAEIGRPRTDVFFIGRGAGGVPSLFLLRAEADGPQELIEGVEMMQLLYGVDTENSGAINVYRSAA
jgi:type IV pilus assembly protein PilW